MDSVLDFAKAAAPWVAMGVTAAVLAVRHASKGAKKKKCEKFGGDCGSFFGQRNTERLRSGLGDESSTP